MGIKEHLHVPFRKKHTQKEAGLDRYSAFFEKSVYRIIPLHYRATRFLYEDPTLSHPFDLQTVRLSLASLDAVERTRNPREKFIDDMDRDVFRLAMNSISTSQTAIAIKMLPYEQQAILKDQKIFTAYLEEAERAARVIFDAKGETSKSVEAKMKHVLVPRIAMLRNLRDGTVTPK